MKKYFSIFLFIFSCISYSYDFSEIKKNISTFTLDNGLKFILYEDHSVPVANFATLANVGASDERIGIWGISHLLEHMAFKGTKEIGTTNYKEEAKLFEKIDAIYSDILKEKSAINPDAAKITKLSAELDELSKKADAYVISNELDTILKRNGGVDLNAYTNRDRTLYHYSLPSNKLELWAYLESKRFIDPVLREFYKEKNVVMEERRMGRENSPDGKLWEQFSAIAFKDHPYRNDVIGPMSNLETITRDDVASYFRTNYNASNLVIGVAGDITPKDLREIAEKYFSLIPSGEKKNRIATVEPEQNAEKSLIIYENLEPKFMMGYHIPSIIHEDFIKFSFLAFYLSSGRSTKLYKELVVKKKLALYVRAWPGFPGDKYDSLFTITAAPNKKISNDEIIKLVMEEIEKLKKAPIREKEITATKTRMKRDFIDGLKSNSRLLEALLEYETVLGSWEKVFSYYNEIDKLKASDIAYVAGKYLRKTNLTIARLEKTRLEKKGGK